MNFITIEDYKADLTKFKLVLKKYSKPRYLLSYSLIALGGIMLDSYFSTLLSRIDLVCG